MLEGFKDQDNPWRSILVALHETLEATYGPSDELPSGETPGGACSTCAALPYTPDAGVPQSPRNVVR